MNGTTIITSRDNAKLAIARKVRDGKIDDLIFIEGLRLAEEALRSDIVINDCFVTSAFAKTGRGGELIGMLRKENIAVAEASEKLFRSIADTKNSQGVVLIAERPADGRTAIEKDIQLTESAIVVLLNEVNDPSNLGAVFRTVEAAGVAGIVVSKGSADVFSPKALRAAMGASLRIPVWENADLPEVFSWSRTNGLRTTAADIGAELSHTDIDWKRRHLIVFGSEAQGLDEAVLEAVDETMTIPMQNGVESLNLAVSAGIILFEAVRQRTG